MEWCKFIIGKRPIVYWDHDLSKKNLRYLRGLDTDYYFKATEIILPSLEGENKIQAATLLRTLYHQATETLLAHICAGLQAPHCVLGWMQSYRTNELRELVYDITEGNCRRVHSAFTPVSWDSIALMYLPKSAAIYSSDEKIHEKFGDMFRRLALSYQNDINKIEYNSLKHGLRVQRGGFKMKVESNTDGTSIHLHGSDFGSVFFRSSKVSLSGLDYQPTEILLNWNIDQTVQDLRLISIALKNVVSYFRWIGGEETKFEFCYPNTPEAFNPIKCGIEISSAEFGAKIDPSSIPNCSKEQLIADLKANGYDID